MKGLIKRIIFFAVAWAIFAITFPELWLITLKFTLIIDLLALPVMFGMFLYLICLLIKEIDKAYKKYF